MNQFPIIIFFLSLICHACSNNHHESLTVQEKNTIVTKVAVSDTSKNLKGIHSALFEDPFQTRILKLLITNNFNSYFVYKGEEAGLEFELLRLYVKQKGWNLQLKHIHDVENLEDSMQLYGTHMAAASLVIPEQKPLQQNYSFPLYKTDLVLVMKPEVKKKYFEGQKINIEIIKNASYRSKIFSVFDSLGKKVEIKTSHPHATEELLLEDVALGKLEATVADKQEAEILQSLYPELDISTIIEKKVPVGFAIHPSASVLREDFNQWIAENRKLSDYQWTIKKYEKWPDKIRHTIHYSLPALTEGKLSLFDDLVKEHAEQLDWDWRLLAALIYQESKFDPTKVSGAGACGLMQIMPSVGLSYANLQPQELFVPPKNMKAGATYLDWLKSNFYKNDSIKKEDKIKFILASYNAGPGHVQDARALARKHGLDPNKWEGNTEQMMLAKAHPKYFKDPLSKHGYCRGRETVIYVRNIMNYFQHYSNFYHQGTMAKQ